MTELIEVIYILDNDVDADTISEVFDVLEHHGGRSRGRGSYQIGYWDEGGELTIADESREEVTEKIATHPTSSVSVKFDEFGLSIGRDHLDWGGGRLQEVHHLNFQVQTAPFRESDPENAEAVQRRRRKFADLLGDIAEVIDPTYGFGRPVVSAITYDPSSEEIEGTGVTRLFDYNLFNDRAVERIGRETLLDASVWHVEELSTGSILLIVRKPPQECPATDPDCQAIAERFGLQKH